MVVPISTGKFHISISHMQSINKKTLTCTHAGVWSWIHYFCIFKSHVFLIAVMSMYACVVLLAVGVAMASAIGPGCWYCLPEPICEPCICRVQAKQIDVSHNGIFAPWFNSVFDKQLRTICPPPKFQKFYYYLPNFAKCECQEDKFPQTKCTSEIWKLQNDAHKKVLSLSHITYLYTYILY